MPGERLHRTSDAGPVSQPAAELHPAIIQQPFLRTGILPADNFPAPSENGIPARNPGTSDLTASQGGNSSEAMV